MLLPLDLLSAGEVAEVAEVCGEAATVGRLAELGLRQGCRLQMLQVDNCRLCLRGSDCTQVFVRPVSVPAA
jgi:ferrous iron transport protein A